MEIVQERLAWVAKREQEWGQDKKAVLAEWRARWHKERRQKRS